MRDRVPGRRFTAALGVGVLAVVGALGLVAHRALGEDVEWSAWSAPDDLPGSGPWLADMTNLATVRFEDVASLRIEHRRGVVAPKGQSARELRWRAADGRSTTVSDLWVGNGEVLVDDEARRTSALLVDRRGGCVDDPEPPGSSVERLR